MSETGDIDFQDGLQQERDSGPERLKKAPHAYRTISEVADELHVPQHVLRFWETRFPEVKPLKRGGGRRYYRPEDVDILRHISDLLYVQGYTIKGVQRVLRETASLPSSGRIVAGAEGDESAEKPADVLSDKAHEEHIVFPPAPAENPMDEEPSPEAHQADEPEAESLEDGQESSAPVAYVSEEENVEIEVIEHTAAEPQVVADPALVAAVGKLEAERALLRMVLRDVLDELDGIRRMLPVS